MARAKAQDETKIELQFESRIVSRTDSLDGDGKATETNLEVYRRYPLEGLVYEELVETNGRPLTEDEARKERKKRDTFIREVREKAERGEEYETGDERTVRFDDELMSRYRASVIGTALVDGAPTWVVDFEPREGKLPEHSRMDKALNRSSGRLYIAQRDYGIARIEFQMRRPVKYMWGLLATLRRVDGQLNFERVEENVWLPKSFDLAIDLRIFIRRTRRHISREWAERKRLTLSTTGC